MFQLFQIHSKVSGKNCIEYSTPFSAFAQFVPKEYQGEVGEPCTELGYSHKLLRMSVYQKSVNPFATPAAAPAPTVK